MISTHKIVKTAVINLQTDLNNKAETSLSNLSPEGKHYVAFKGYDSIASYSLNDVVASIQNNEVKIYQSLVDNNTSSLSDTTQWKEVSLGGGNVIIFCKMYLLERGIFFHPHKQSLSVPCKRLDNRIFLQFQSHR